ncbi:hypothetical protein BJY54_006109 [Streptomyces nodosus]|nr:hypothetical protein [Streptomyces nodosus]
MSVEPLASAVPDRKKVGERGVTQDNLLISYLLSESSYTYGVST